MMVYEVASFDLDKAGERDKKDREEVHIKSTAGFSRHWLFDFKELVAILQTGRTFQILRLKAIEDYSQYVKMVFWRR